MGLWALLGSQEPLVAAVFELPLLEFAAAFELPFREVDAQVCQRRQGSLSQ